MNQKGGVGKTATTLCLGDILSGMGKKVLIIDLDQQMNTTSSLGLKQDYGSSFDLITGKNKNIVQKLNKMDAIRGDLNLAHYEDEAKKTKNPFNLLAFSLEPLKKDYDFIIIDTPPALGVTTMNALVAANGVVIVSQAMEYSIEGVKRLFETIVELEKRIGRRIPITGVLITMLETNPTPVLDKQMIGHLKEMCENLGYQLFPGCIRKNISIRESQLLKQGIAEYAPKSAGAKDYLAFAEELLRRVK